MSEYVVTVTCSAALHIKKTLIKPLSRLGFDDESQPEEKGCKKTHFLPN